MKYYGIAGASLHDAGITLLDDQGNIEFASLSERYTKVKHDGRIDPQLWSVLYQLQSSGTPHKFVMNDDWEQRFLLRTEKSLMGHVDREREMNPNETLLHRKHPYSYVTQHGALVTEHHVAHACSAFMTRPKSFAKEDCVNMVVDGIGEWRSAAIYDSEMNRLWTCNYPKSLGYLYARFTDQVPHMNLRSNEDEYVVMGLSSYGQPTHWEKAKEMFGCIEEWGDDEFGTEKDDRDYTAKLFYLNRILQYWEDNCATVEDAAASLQRMAEEVLLDIAREARKYGSKLCYSGGVAQNIVANSRIRELFDDIWVDVNPGDGGASLGAAGYQYMQDTGADRINWTNPFLGYNIDGTLDPEVVVDHILEHKVCGIANGKAEFSYRAYGNRSLIGDVRYDVKETVNNIKRRQQFRPFAPAILEEHAHEYFDGAMNEWMQYCAKAKHDYSSVTHVDGTGRVQLVPKDCSSVFRKVLECYYEKTGVPMLLNTSLNIRGMPMVNDEDDAREFEEKYGVKVFTK